MQRSRTVSSDAHKPGMLAAAARCGAAAGRLRTAVAASRPQARAVAPSSGTFVARPCLSGNHPITPGQLRGASSADGAKDVIHFDESDLEHLACPISKTPLRYDALRRELVADAVHVAYPVVNGVPHLIPADARIIPEAER